jgi:hypothetical protein
MDPGPPSNIGSDSEIWYYCFYPTNPPVQYGTYTNTKIYWLAVYTLLPNGETNYFGWKTTTNLQFDISVHTPFNPAGCPSLTTNTTLPGPWTPNMTPSGRPLDLAFMLTTSCLQDRIKIRLLAPNTNKIVLTWTYGILQSRTHLDHPFTDVPFATSPYTNTVMPANWDQFFRLRCP